MKTKLSVIALTILVASFTACKKDETNPKVNKNETVTMGATYTNDVYYSLKNGVVATVPRTNWDIAFSVSTRSSSIIINEGAGVVLKAYPTPGVTYSSTLDVTGFDNWTPVLRNSDIDWEIGAFNANATTHPNYGWGIYNSTSHNIDGSVLYIIKLQDGTFKKIFIDKKFSALQKYTFRFANVDGTDEHVITEMDLSASKANYVYYSLKNNAIITDREPDATTWDLLFTKWVDNTISYPVTGVLQNIGTKAIDVTTDNIETATYTDDQFVADINTIGSDWKTTNANYQFDIAANRVFFVKNKDGKVFKIKFTSFTGSSTGVVTFDIKEL